MTDPVVLQNVEKQYGGLRPLRVRDLRVRAEGVTLVLGFDRPAAEALVNLITGASLPERGDVISLGRSTRDIVDGNDWLAFAERFGIASDRIVLLDAMTVAQNLALSFDLELDPVPPDVRARVASLALEAGIPESQMDVRAADAAPLLRARIYLARALALDPSVLVLEHPTARLQPDDAKDYAATIAQISQRRRLTILGLLMDEAFAKAVGGRLLFWKPATGEIHPRSGFRFW